MREEEMTTNNKANRLHDTNRATKTSHSLVSAQTEKKKAAKEIPPT